MQKVAYDEWRTENLFGEDYFTENFPWSKYMVPIVAGLF